MSTVSRNTQDVIDRAFAMGVITHDVLRREYRRLTGMEDDYFEDYRTEIDPKNLESKRNKDTNEP